MLPLLGDCGILINRIFDGDDGVVDGTATEFVTLRDTCVSISLDELLMRIRQLDAEGCHITTNGVAETTVAMAGRRRRRNQISSGDDAKCPLADYTNRIDAVNEACCDEPGICADGIPTVCDLKCALEFLPFLSECGTLVNAIDPAHVQRTMIGSG